MGLGVPPCQGDFGVAPPGVPREGFGGKKRKTQRNFKVQERDCAGAGLGTGIPKDGAPQQLPKTSGEINPIIYLIYIYISEQPEALPSSELQAGSRKGLIFFLFLYFFF